MALPNAAELASQFKQSSNAFARIEKTRPRTPTLDRLRVLPPESDQAADPLEQTVDIPAEDVAAADSSET